MVSCRDKVDICAKLELPEFDFNCCPIPFCRITPGTDSDSLAQLRQVSSGSVTALKGAASAFEMPFFICSQVIRSTIYSMVVASRILVVALSCSCVVVGGDLLKTGVLEAE